MTSIVLATLKKGVWVELCRNFKGYKLRKREEEKQKLGEAMTMISNTLESFLSMRYYMTLGLSKIVATSTRATGERMALHIESCMLRAA